VSDAAAGAKGGGPVGDAARMRPPNVDHLVFAGPELREGIERIEALLGVGPVPGGRHPRFGTHNALLSLGSGTYLEVIAPDPTLERPSRGLPFAMGDPSGWRLATWALRAEPIDEIAAGAAGLGAVQDGRRARPDGTVLTWRLTDPYAMPLSGVVPFLISWGDTPHPSGAAPVAGTLRALRVEHPQPERVRSALEVLGAPVRVDRAAAAALVATIATERGSIELR